MLKIYDISLLMATRVDNFQFFFLICPKTYFTFATFFDIATEKCIKTSNLLTNLLSVYRFYTNKSKVVRYLQDTNAGIPIYMSINVSNIY